MDLKLKELKLFILLALLSSIYSHAQIVNIPDANFKNALINHNPVIDLNGDGEIQLNEAMLATSIFVSGQNIQDLTGIETFVNLEQLLCGNNQIVNLDLSANVNLTSIQCQVNAFSALDFTDNINLGLLNCGSSLLTSLQLPVISSQIAVYCTNGQLSSLDVTQLPGLVVLAASGNNISSMDLSQNGNLNEIYLNNNILSSVNLIGASNLERIQINNNPIEEVDISKNLELVTFVFGDTGITNMDLSNHPNLLGVFGENNLLETMNLKNGNNEVLTFLNLTNNPNLECIQVDDEDMANNGIGSYELWMKDSFALYSEECEILGLNENSIKTISVFPNPVIDNINIESNSEINSLIILNTLGQVLISEQVSKKTTHLNLESLEAGSYFIEIKSKDSIERIKIIKD